MQDDSLKYYLKHALQETPAIIQVEVVGIAFIGKVVGVDFYNMLDILFLDPELLSQIIGLESSAVTI
jgi:hypothetical protein